MEQKKVPNSPPPVLPYAHAALPPPPQMSRPPPAKPMDLDLTIVSAKHLKNVNWRSGGDLKPYAVFWVDPDRRLATKSDDSGSTRPVWNERFTLSLSSPSDSFLTLEIFHSKPSDTPKPLVGTLRISLRDLPDPDDPSRIRTFTLSRPSGRPQGKIRLKLALRERPPPPDYHVPPPPPPAYFYSAAPPPPPPSARDYRGYSPPPPPPPQYASSHSPQPPYGYGSYAPEAYSSGGAPYYSGYYSSAPPPPRPFFGGGSGPSAPVDYSPYDQGRPKGGKLGIGAGLAVGAIAGGLGGLAIEEGLKYEEEKIADRVESDLASARDDYSDYHRADY